MSDSLYDIKNELSTLLAEIEYFKSVNDDGKMKNQQTIDYVLNRISIRIGKTRETVSNIITKQEIEKIQDEMKGSKISS